MYQVSNPAVLLRGRRRTATGETARLPVKRTVFLLGLTSLFTDISAEMVVTVLPLYLVYIGNFSPLAFGVIDGLYNGATAIATLASGYVGDRFKKHKEVAATGYGLSAICKLLLVAAGTAMSAIGAIVLLDRAGKGIRTAPRDAMISLATPRASLGTAFGVHRAMDTVGAMLGPLVAFGLLAIAPLAFDSVFLVSFCFALIGVGILVLLVQPERDRDAEGAEPPPPATLRGAFGLVKVPRFRAVLVAGALLSLATASDAFVFLALEDAIDLGTTLFPLLFVGNAAAFMVLAVPMGRLADRIGRGRVLLLGYGALLAVYAVLLGPLGGWPLVVATLFLLGTYYAATDGVLMALGSPVIPDEIRGSGLALLRTTTSLARLVASIAFGAVWMLWGISAALAVFAAALVAAVLVSAFLFVRAPEPA